MIVNSHYNVCSKLETVKKVIPLSKVEFLQKNYSAYLIIFKYIFYFNGKLLSALKTVTILKLFQKQGAQNF